MMGDPGTSDTMLPHPTFGIPRRHAPSSALEPSVPSFSNSLHRQPPPVSQTLHRPVESFRQDGCEEWSSRDSHLGAGSSTGLRDCVEDQVPGRFCPSRDMMTRARVGEDDLFTFPEGERDAVTMTPRDLASLQPGKFLTDNTVDFYIQYLKETSVSPQNQNEFHFFNSFFFTKLLEKSSSTGIDECKVDYEQLRMWTAGVNLFEKDYIFIPIIESLHWSLIVLCHLKSLNPNSHAKRKGQPCILHLDPIEGKHEHFESQIRSYILQAWMERMRSLDNMDILHSLVQMKYIQAKVPQQDNNYDCGLYVLHYIEVFLSKWISQDLSFLSSEGKFTRQNFKMEVFNKRNYIQGLIFKLGGMLQVQDVNLFDTQPKHQDNIGLVHSPKCQDQVLPKLAKETKSKKWKEIETSILLQCMVDGDRFCNRKFGNMHWDLIAEAINLKSNGGPLRSKEQCQNRFDTLLKAYKELYAYCDQIGKKFCEVTDDEKRSLKLATPLKKKDEGWYNNLHTINSELWKSRKRQKLKLDGDIENNKFTSSPLKSLGECSTPLNLIGSLESKKTSSRQAAFAKARDHQLPSLSQMPSSAWIPEYRSHNTSTDKVTSFEPRDVNSGKKCTSDNIQVAAYVRCDGLKTKQTSVGFEPPLIESRRGLETNLDLQPSTSRGSDVLRRDVGYYPDDNLLLRNQLPRLNVDFNDFTCDGFEVTPAGTSFPTSDDNGCNKHRWSEARTNPRMHIPAKNRPQTPPQRPDLLTGDEWHSGEIGSQIPPIFDAGTAGESLGVARAADWSVTSIAEALKLQLKLTNHAPSLEMNPRYHVRRISFIVNLLEDECDPDDVVNSLSLEDQELLNWQAPTEDLQDDLKVRNDLSCLSGRLCPSKNSLLSLCDKVTADDGHEQRRGPHPLACYRHISYRSAMLTKHSAADGDVQTLFLYDGTAGDRSCWRRRSHEYIKLLVLPEVMSPYRAFWLVQWDVVDMRHVVQGDPDRGLCSNPAAVESDDDLRKLHNVRWFGEVTAAGTRSPISDGNGLNRYRGSDAITNPRMSILVNEKSQTSRQTQPLRISGVDRLFPTISENSESGGDSTVDSSSVNACLNVKKQSPCTPPRREFSDDTKNATRGHTVQEISTQQTNRQNKQPILSDGRKTTAGIMRLANYRKYIVSIRAPKWTDNQFWISCEDLEAAQYIADAAYYFTGRPPFHFPDATFDYPPLLLSTGEELTTREKCSAYMAKIAKGSALRGQRRDFKERAQRLICEMVKTPNVVQFLIIMRASPRQAWQPRPEANPEDTDSPFTEGENETVMEVDTPSEEAYPDLRLFFQILDMYEEATFFLG